MSAIDLERSPVVIKDEPRTKITVEGDLVRKVYLTSLLLGWRTWLRPSRAKREFDNLAEMRARGIMAVEPVSYRESRRLGVSLESEIATRFVPNAVNFRDMIRGLSSAHGEQEVRDFRAAARLVGASLRRMHDRGIMFASASPRNWIIDRDRFPADESCVVCDPAYTAFSPGSLEGTPRAAIDLYMLVFSHGRRTTLSSSQRLRILLGYTGGNRDEARRTWQELATRRGWVHSLLRAFWVVAGRGSWMLWGRTPR